MTIKGVDVSKYQGDIDFDKLAGKVNFIIIRGAAIKTKDVKLERNVAEAKRVGLPYGLFFAPIPPGLTGFQEQAYFHADLLAQYGSQIFPAFDLEVDGGLSTAELGVWMDKYINWFCSRSGITDLSSLMTYTRASWFDYQMPNNDAIFCQTRLWLADWTPPPDTIPIVWKDRNKSWFFWQTGVYKPATDYGCPAPPYGAAGIDLDEFYGTDDDFLNLFGVKPHYPADQPPPPPPPPPPALPKYVYTKGDVTNVRNAPILAEMSDIGDLTKGATLEVVAQTGDFYQFKAYVHKTVVTDSNTPPPPPPPAKTGWYIAHDREIVYPEGHEHAGKPILWRHDVPEVFHFDVKGNMGAWVITKAWQELIMALNPGMLGDIKPVDDGGGFRNLLWWNLAFTNGPGYDNPNGVPRRDWINGRDLDAADPVADKSRICGGAFVHGILNGNILTIETLDGTKDPPPLDWILARPWLYFECVTVHADGTNGRFPQNGHGKRPVYFPLVASEPQTVQINTVVEAKPYPYVTKI